MRWCRFQSAQAGPRYGLIGSGVLRDMPRRGSGSTRRVSAVVIITEPC